jgi:glycerophosphoryl diester phosphodiesterase
MALHPVIVAHRGGPIDFPENSLGACRAALALGVDEVQLDVHPSRDGRVLVIHDPTLDRTTSLRGAVIAFDWSVLRGATLIGRGAERLPLLEDVLSLLQGSDVRLRLEIKAGPGGRPYSGFPARIAERLRHAHAASRTTLTAFSLATLTEAGRLIPEARLRWLVSSAQLAQRNPARCCAITRRLRIDGIGLRWSGLATSDVQCARDFGLTLGAFGCHDCDSLQSAFALGAAEITTDRPDLALRIRGNR